jgi:hypothetical protein
MASDNADLQLWISAVFSRVGKFGSYSVHVRSTLSFDVDSFRVDFEPESNTVEVFISQAPEYEPTSICSVDFTITRPELVAQQIYGALRHLPSAPPRDTFK